uniref:ZT_dimer domain-containing protein n=1 Tax=Steinernema glaseri TaxID=37863 RepID=A0A1I7ZJ76_9BILA
MSEMWCLRVFDWFRGSDAVEEFYSYQNYIEECKKEDEELLKKDLETHVKEDNAKDKENQQVDDYLAKLTLAINIGMIFAKATAAYFSNSMSVVKFYSYQNYIEECKKEDEELLKKDLETHVKEDNAKDKENQQVDDYLAKLTLAINIGMIFAKATAAYFSNSMSVVSTVVDSVMDVTSGAVIWAALRASEKTCPYSYPVGRSRLEPLAVLIVAVVMIIANLLIIAESIRAVVEHTLDPRVDIKTLAILVTGTSLKYGLYDTPSSNVLAQDQGNDVATNIVALAAVYIGNRWWIYADSVGAILISSYIIMTWVETAGEQIPQLVGKAAPPEFISRITSIAVNHDHRIKGLDTVYVYHMGANFLVELHVLMDETLPLKEAHDVSEDLQVKIERMPYVERAFVHVDYKLDGDEHLAAKKYK